LMVPLVPLMKICVYESVYVGVSVCSTPYMREGGGERRQQEGMNLTCKEGTRGNN
jgi:hypothetical protein